MTIGDSTGSTHVGAISQNQGPTMLSSSSSATRYQLRLIFIYSVPLEGRRGTDDLTADSYVKIPARLESGLRLWA